MNIYIYLYIYIFIYIYIYSYIYISMRANHRKAIRLWRLPLNVLSRLKRRPTEQEMPLFH